MILYNSAEKARKAIIPFLNVDGGGVIMTVKCKDGMMRFLGETFKGYTRLIDEYLVPFHIITTLDREGNPIDYNGPTITEKQLNSSLVDGMICTYDDNLE